MDNEKRPVKIRFMAGGKHQYLTVLPSGGLGHIANDKYMQITNPNGKGKSVIKYEARKIVKRTLHKLGIRNGRI